MTTRSTKKSANPAAKAATKTRKPQPATSAGERVIRHELLGGCSIALVSGTAATIGKKAADALVEALQGVFAKCTVQCEGYVFNLYMVPLLVPELEPQTKTGKAGS